VCHRGSYADLEDRLDVSVLLPNGDVSLCGQDYGLQNILGNLLKTDYVSLFQSDTFKKIREKMKSHDSDIICRNCHEAMPESELIERRKIKNDYVNDKTALSIIHLYQKLLQRYPDKVGFNHFYSKISNDELTIQGLEDIISQSTEYTNTRPIKLGLKHFS
jgi:radical SAM protein with 4Fe4S-binding SPASM domain